MSLAVMLDETTDYVRTVGSVEFVSMLCQPPPCSLVKVRWNTVTLHNTSSAGHCGPVLDTYRCGCSCGTYAKVPSRGCLEL